MLSKNFYLAALLGASVSCVSFAVTVEALVQLQVGDKVQESTLIIDSERYTELSMKDETLGFILKLHNTQPGHESFETTPTSHGQPIAKFFYSSKQMTLGAGCKLNGHVIEKELIVKFLNIKQLP